MTVPPTPEPPMDTGYVDPVFPLPQPTFLWVHPLVIGARGATSITPDGRWTHAITDTEVTGYITAPNPTKDRAAGTDLVRIDAVALVPNGTPVNAADELRAGAGCPAVLQGRYLVEVVRPNPSHTRILLVRAERQSTPRGS